MKREKIMDRLHQAAQERLLCRVYMKGKAYYINCWPLLVSDELLVCAHDVDFLLNGYGAYPIGGIDRVVIKEDKCNEYSRLEGVVEQIVVPEVACESWQTLFASLPTDRLVGVERVNAPEDEAFFAVGRIVKAGKNRLHMMCVDSEAVWEDAPWRIRYSDIREVTFADRYLTVFGKYAGEPEQSAEAPDAQIGRPPEPLEVQP